jgi:hypothetical protein
MVDTQFYLLRTQRDRLATVYAVSDGKLERAQEYGSAGQGAFSMVLDAAFQVAQVFCQRQRITRNFCG